MLTNNLPILLTYPDWIVRKWVDGSGWFYLIPGWMIIRNSYSGSDELTPGIDYYSSNRTLARNMYNQRPDEFLDVSYDNYPGIQIWFDRIVKGWSSPSQRPKCKRCGKTLSFTKVSHGGYGHSYYDPIPKFCSYTCRAEYYNELNLIGFGLMANNPDNYPEMKEWYEYGGGLKYYQDHKDEYVKCTGQLDSLTTSYENYLISTLGESRGRSGVYKSYRFRKYLLHRSQLELDSIIKLESDPNVIDIEYETLKIPYFDYDEIQKIYIPDLLVTYNTGQKVVIEVKPESQKKDPTNLRKFRAAIWYCVKKNWKFKVWTENEIYN